MVSLAATAVRLTTPADVVTRRCGCAIANRLI
jgi:hypothetical protein